jgi:hypothetical protein
MAQYLLFGGRTGEPHDTSSWRDLGGVTQRKNGKRPAADKLARRLR